MYTIHCIVQNTQYYCDHSPIYVARLLLQDVGKTIYIIELNICHLGRQFFLKKIILFPNVFSLSK